MASAATNYPTKAAIERTVAAARACNIPFDVLEVTPEGVIRLLPAPPANDTGGGNAFDDWKKTRQGG
jgi:hypothetical protein